MSSDLRCTLGLDIELFRDDIPVDLEWSECQPCYLGECRGT